MHSFRQRSSWMFVGCYLIPNTPGVWTQKERLVSFAFTLVKHEIKLLRGEAAGNVAIIYLMHIMIHLRKIMHTQNFYCEFNFIFWFVLLLCLSLGLPAFISYLHFVRFISHISTIIQGGRGHWAVFTLVPKVF